MDQQLKDRILVALDVESRTEALKLADLLRGTVGGFKIGSRLFTAKLMLDCATREMSNRTKKPEAR